MFDVEISSQIKMVAAIVAILAAYLSPSDWLKSLFSKVNPIKPVIDTTAADTAKVDAALRTLLEDSQRRQCRESIEYLNNWLEVRNLSSIPKPTPTPVTRPAVSEPTI